MIDELLNKLSSQEKSALGNEIFAPYVKGGSKILIRINKIIYKLKTPKFKKDGFGVFKAFGANHAKLVRSAEPYEIDEYLQLLPKADFVLVYKVGRWLAYPVNESSFKHRFKAEPKLLNILAVDNVELLDTITARFDGTNFWFDSLKFGGDVEKKEGLRKRIEEQSYTVTKNVSSGLTPEELTAFKYACQFHREATMSDLEKRLNNELGKFGAKVDKFTERGDNVSVQWKDGQTNSKYTSVFKKDNLDVVTAGICLSGGDKVFDLQSLVGVVRQAQNRGGVVHVGDGGMEDERYWDMYGDNVDDDY